MSKIFKILKDFVIWLLKKAYELIGAFCDICSACRRYDFDSLDDKNNKKDE